MSQGPNVPLSYVPMSRGPTVLISHYSSEITNARKSLLEIPILNPLLLLHFTFFPSSSTLSRTTTINSSTQCHRLYFTVQSPSSSSPHCSAPSHHHHPHLTIPLHLISCLTLSLSLALTSPCHSNSVSCLPFSTVPPVSDNTLVTVSGVNRQREKGEEGGGRGTGVKVAH